jgi:DNA modification methylase
MTIRVIHGDCRAVLPSLAENSVNCVVTSPPYYGLRDYGVAGQMGLESTLAEYVAEMVAVFRQVRRVLRDDGSLWLNVGDSFNAYNGNRGPSKSISGNVNQAMPSLPTGAGLTEKALKNKDLMMVPARLAIALQDDGWWLRADIIWHKPNPMPESITDRPTSAHEHVFLLTKAAQYFYDAEAAREDSITNDPRRPYGSEGAWQIDGRPSEQRHGGEPRAPANVKRGGFNGKTNAMPGREAFRAFTATRNLRNVWTIPTQAFPGSHFATMPPELAERCIKAGCPVGGTVLDPFGGAGTTGLVADRLGRDAVLIELNPNYGEMARRRIASDAPLFAEVVS